MNRSPLEALLALGEAMLAAGAEPYRTEEAIERAGNGFGCSAVHAFVTPPGLFITVQSAGAMDTGVRRVRARALDVARITSLNALARAAERGSLSPGECMQAIEGLRQRVTDYGAPLELVAGAVASAAYAWFIGATAPEAGLAALAGAFTVVLRRRSAERFAERFFNLALAGFSVALVGLAAALLWHLRSGVIAAGGLIVLVPGLAVSGVLRDLLAGDLLSAGAGGLEAATSAAALASGAALAVGLGLSLGWAR
ncbi:MAG: threonine/serine exporter family protein [Thermaerobacter sp.]|nr:threonine/serine exporter family protein [Thermaerobacter sp.]